jgi:hypothetical protein
MSGVMCISVLGGWQILLSESSWTVIVVTALVKEGESEGQGHTFENLLHQSAT